MPSEPLALGIDIGGTRVRAGLVDAQGVLRARAETATDARGGPAAVVAQIVKLADEVAASVERGDLVGAGVSAPGPLDTVRGVALGVPTLRGWVDVPIAALLAEALGLAVRLENDGIAAANGEWRFGAGRGLSSLVYVTVSTGVGGGVVADGRLLRGRFGMAGHVGHMTVVRDGTLCSCGSRGCWEAYASGTAFAVRAGREPRAVFAAAMAGDAAALAQVAEEADWLGLGIANLCHLYSPERVILGGGVAKGFALLEPGIRARLLRNAMPAFRDVGVTAAALGENAGLVGAAALLFEGKG
jgi:glucokinase